MSSLDQSISSHALPHASRRFAGDAGTLGAVFRELDPDIRSEWAWENYRHTIERLSAAFGLRRLVEIGGGRDPLLTPRQVEELGVEYTVNDISEEELRNAPAQFNKARFDVAGDIADAGIAPESYDLAFSRMVFEHVRDTRAAWANLNTVLAPGGVALAFVPTLYALPYVANMMIPEWLSLKIVKLLYPHRTDDEDPKFPAFYDWCYSSERKMLPMLRGAGFRDALIVPFYGHDYFEPIPVVRKVDEAITRLAIRFDWRALTPYAYIVARK